MRVQIYAGLVAKAVKFPDEIEIRIFPLRRGDGKPVGGSFPMEPLRSLAWLEKVHQISEEQVRQLEAGEGINLLEGNIVAEFADDTRFPEGASYVIVQ